jgi:hypothetical protein
MSQAGKRLTILSKSEIEELYGLPQFSDAERQLFFGLNDSERQAAESRNSIESRVHFILQLGYFKCKTTFFNFSFTQVRDDVKYIVGMYFPNAKIPTIMISKKTSLGQQSSILNLLNIQYFNQKKQNELSVFLNKEVRTCVDPRYLFDKTLDFLNQHNISLPGYSTLQDMISQTLTAEDQRLQKIIQQNLSTSVNQSLSKMLEADDEKMYGITLLKRDAKGFNTTEMTKEIHKQLASTEIFTAAKQIIPKLQISDQNIRYYAYLVDYYTVDRLKELSGHAAKLYLLCYALYRFEKINDNLVYGFIYHLNSYKKEAKEYGKDAVYGFKVEGQQYGKKIGKILDLFTDEKIADSNPFGDVRSLAFRVVKKEKFPVMKRHVTRDFDEEEFRWSYYKKIARTISRNLRPIVKVLDFASEEKNLPLMQAITFLKETWKSGKSLTQMSETKFPTSCITKSLEAYLYETVSGTKEKGKKEKPKKILNVYAYEFMVYDQLAKALESGGLFINNSFRFKSLQEDLIPDWQTKKGTILADLNNLMLNTPIKKQLETFKEELESLIVKVNKRIANGENKHVTIKTSKDKTGLETKTLKKMMKLTILFMSNSPSLT